MTISAAKQWANFLVKLGRKETKKCITDYIITHQMNRDEVWDHFVAQCKHTKEAANVNHIRNADDVDAYFREVSYIKMRGTYPRRHNGRSFAVPRFKTIQEIQAEKGIPKPSAEMIGALVVHALFGHGTITNIISNEYIVVEFQNHGSKVSHYQSSVEKGFLRMVSSEWEGQL